MSADFGADSLRRCNDGYNVTVKVMKEEYVVWWRQRNKSVEAAKYLEKGLRRYCQYGHSKSGKFCQETILRILGIHMQGCAKEW